MMKFALVGNPNCGKTTLFNLLTHSHMHVGNFPGVTVEKKEGQYNENIKIIDLPGIYSLTPFTLEEAITKEYLLSDEIDVILNVVDASNLNKSLYLTSQLIELNKPIILLFNMIDKVDIKQINIKKIEEVFKVKIVLMSALKNENINSFNDIATIELLKSKMAHSILYNSSLKDEIMILKRKYHSLYEAISELEKHKETLIAQTRHSIINKLLKDNKINYKSIKIDKILTNKYLAFPILFFILYFVFHITFSNNLFFLDFIFKDKKPSFAGTAFEGLFYTQNGLNSLGVMLSNFIFSMNKIIINHLLSHSSFLPLWIQSILINGILKGIATVISFLPQVLLLFLCFSIIEESGYMPRISFILDKVLSKIGLTGRCFLPMIMGFGCYVPAMMNTQTLNNEKERTMVLRAIPCFPCTTKLIIMTTLSSYVIKAYDVKNSDLLLCILYFICLFIFILSMNFMNKTIKVDNDVSFMMELPEYSKINFKSLKISLMNKGKSFLKKVFTTIVISNVILWFISHFSYNLSYLNDSQIDKSLLADISRLLQPIFTPLGFGSQLNKQYGWIFIVSIISGIFAKENVISSLVLASSCLGNIHESNYFNELIIQTNISFAGVIAFIVFNLTTIPCLATLATCKKLQNKKTYRNSLLFWFIVSYVTSMLVFLILLNRYYIFLLLILLLLYFLYLALISHKKTAKNR